jgi:hypothetical protein
MLIGRRKCIGVLEDVEEVLQKLRTGSNASRMGGEGYEKGKQTALALLAYADLPLLYRIRACMTLGCTPSSAYAREGLRTMELHIQNTREKGREISEPELRLLESCKTVLRNAEAAEDDEDDEDEDGEGAAEDDEDEGGEGGELVEGGCYEDGRLVFTPKDGWLDGRGEFGWTLEHGWSDGVPDGIERTPQSVTVEQRTESATIEREPPSSANHQDAFQQQIDLPSRRPLASPAKAPALLPRQHLARHLEIRLTLLKFTEPRRHVLDCVLDSPPLASLVRRLVQLQADQLQQLQTIQDASCVVALHSDCRGWPKTIRRRRELATAKARMMVKARGEGDFV